MCGLDNVSGCKKNAVSVKAGRTTRWCQSMTPLITRLPFHKRNCLCTDTFIRARPCCWGGFIKMRCGRRFDEQIPLLVHLVPERSQQPPWWRTHRLCRADCRQKSLRSHYARKCLDNMLRLSRCLSLEASLLLTWLWSEHRRCGWCSSLLHWKTDWSTARTTRLELFCKTNNNQQGHGTVSKTNII